MNRKFLVLTLLACLAICLPLRAETVAGLYSVVVPVDDYSEQARNRALKAGLEKVLVKLTGDSRIASRAAVANWLDNAPGYALEFSYVDLEKSSSGQGLTASYTRGEIDAFLRRQQLPIWPRERPPVLVWLMVERAGGERGFAGPELEAELYGQLAEAFGDRAMPVRFPVYDLEDQMGLPVAEAWDFNSDAIAGASARYGVGHWLAVRCYETSAGQWRLAWSLGSGERSRLDSLQADTLDSGLAAVVDRAVDRIAADSAYIATGRERAVSLSVAGVHTYASYSDLSRLLAGLSMVQSRSLKTAAGDRLGFELQVDGDWQVLVDTLARSGKLEVVGDNPGAAELSLRWKPGS